MEATEALFKQIVEKLTSRESEVDLGKMMTAPGLRCKGKVFAFFHEDKMTFKLGKDFDPEAKGIRQFSHLSPFKNKPPMKAWFIIPEPVFWEDLAEIALERMQSGKK